MALIGGGGAPNVAGGGNPSGTGNTLQYIDEGVHAAYSGVISPQNNIGSPLTMLDFTTGAIPMIGKLNFSYETGTLAGDKRLGFNLLLNGTKIHEFFDYIGTTHSESMIAQEPEIVFPAHTHIEISVETSNTASAVDTYCTITAKELGRV